MSRTLEMLEACSDLLTECRIALDSIGHPLTAQIDVLRVAAYLDDMIPSRRPTGTHNSGGVRWRDGGRAS